ncbi:MAG: integrase [Candidimonas sp.]|nr:MAG: integrase [Candidimonas sp.]TAM25634.1 MAG: integrase [Candidimonas sp.]TAM76004.1 MAG: integrase [Candidimonas sp.]
MTHLAIQPLGVLVQKFFLQRLQREQCVSPCTVRAYRDSFRLLLDFAHRRLHKPPSKIDLDDLDSPLVLDFLNHLEQERHNTARSRNARLAAIHAFMEYVCFEEPSAMALAQSVLAIPMKRFEQPLVGFVSREQMQAILNAPDLGAWTGQRDQVMLATLYNTGARVSELISMRVCDLTLSPSAWVRIHGKGRKERAVPLWPRTAKALRYWLRQYPRAPDGPLFPGRGGRTMTRVSVADRLRLAVQGASKQFPELARRRVSPHVIRHTVAMHMLQSGVDITVIALWLGHESPITTHRYIEADLQMKERALRALSPPLQGPLRYQPGDSLLKFLQAL